MKQPILTVNSLNVGMSRHNIDFALVNDVSFSMYPGELLAIVGESGSGKSMTALSIMKLLPKTSHFAGEIVLGSMHLEKRTERQMQSIRGKDISMIFQEPMTSLTPTIRAGAQIDEALHLHTDLSRSDRRKRTLELLTMVGIGAPERVADEFPHRLSGGLRQRVMIAMAMACTPKVLIADEPTTALDVTVQVQILQTIQRLAGESLAVLLITHNLGVVAEYCHRVLVMYAGQVVESGTVLEIFQAPRHPYTKALIEAVPNPLNPKTDFVQIPGPTPVRRRNDTGCAFAPRCWKAITSCFDSEPVVHLEGSQHSYRCHIPIEY